MCMIYLTVPVSPPCVIVVDGLIPQEVVSLAGTAATRVTEGRRGLLSTLHPTLASYSGISHSMLDFH